MERWLGHWGDLKEQGTLTFEGELRTKGGRFFPVEIAANYFEYEGRSFDLGLARDITERKKAERERLANLRFFESMDKVNRAIQAADDLEEMMRELLDVVLSILDCDRAFLMYPCDPQSATWSSPMERNKPEYPGVRDLKQEIPMDPQVAETLRILLAADGPVAFGPGSPHALPEDVSRQFGFKSFMSMAIYPKNGSPWQFGIHQCACARVWTAEEMRVFEAIGRRLADSLSSLLSYRDLRKNEEFLDNVVEHIPNMIFVKDARTLRFVRFNKAGERLLGYAREELLGRTDHDFFPKEAADFFLAKDREVLTARQLVDIAEETIRNRRNEERILHTQKIPILDETGAPQYLLGISEDITERKQAEASIRKLSQVVEQSPVSIIITDVQGRIEFVNAKFTQLTGYSAAEVLGRNPRILKSGETAAETYRQLWETVSSGSDFMQHWGFLPPQVSLFYFRVIEQGRGPAFQHDLAVFNDIAALGEFEGQTGVLFHQQDGGAGLVDLFEGVEHGEHQQRCQAHGGFVQQHQFAAAHISPAHGQHLLLTAAQCAGGLLFSLLQPGENGEYLVDVALEIFLVFTRKGGQSQVFHHRQVAEQPPSFRDMTNPQAADNSIR